jgi:hypothetical protein
MHLLPITTLMKFHLLAVLIFLMNTVKAQDSLEVTESEKQFSKGKHNGFTVKIPQANFKDVKSDWRKYLNQKLKFKPKEEDGEIVTGSTLVPELSSDSLTIYSILFSNLNDVEIVGFVGANDFSFYSSADQPEICNRFKTFLRNFAVNEYRNVVNEELKSENKKLSVLEQNLADLENDSIKSEKKIKSNERLIERINGEIKSNEKLHDLKSESIDQQQKVIATFLTPSDQKSDEEKKLKALQKEKKKIEKENDSLHDDIDDKESENKSLRKQIDKNTAEIIPAKKKEIEKQKEVVSKVELKLKNIH